MKIIIFIIGILIGAITMYFMKRSSFKNHKYIKLTKDYKIEELGVIKKGTILRIDQPMPEGFTRYILYLNLKENDFSNYKPAMQDEIIPYWLHNIDTTSMR